MSDGPCVRADPIVGRRVIIAPERGERPVLITAESLGDDPDDCPFCEGREDRTPPESLAIRTSGSSPDHPGWLVRAVPNRYPAVRPDADGPILARQFPAAGPHEVIIECPRHVVSLAELPEEQIARVFHLWRERIQQLRSSGHLAYVQIFKNHGAASGASLSHAHSQLIGLPVVPMTIAEELAACDCGSSCPYCRWLDAEQRLGERWVTETRRIAAVTAFAGRFPYETWILPRRHESRWDHADDAELAELAVVVRGLLNRLARWEPTVAYNLLLHTAPLSADHVRFHWHLELLPRLTGVAGFEWATGWFINPVLPEVAAERLRFVCSI